MATVTAAARAIHVRNGMLMMDSAARAMSTVVPAKTTEVPAVPVATPIACARCSRLSPRSSSDTPLGSVS